MDSIRCEHLSKCFDGVDALVDVSLELPTNGITAIIGPNGAGKTTLLNILTGFVRPDAGKCFFGEIETTNAEPHRIARMGIARTFQDLRLISQVSVVDNVLTACPNQRGERLLPALLRLGFAKEESRNRDVAISSLQLVGLESHAKDLAGELSYGQQKLLSLAVCLATGARSLMLDEPVAGVAPEKVTQILDLLRKMSAMAKAIVFIEHDIEAVRQTADHVIVMDDGRIVAQGRPSDVLEKAEIMEAYLG